MRRSISGAVLAAVLSLALGSARAEEAEKPKGVRGEILMMIGYLEKRAVGLLEAMPQEKLSWRPAEGVRSASEIFMHMAISPFFLAERVGLPRPKDLSGKLEKTVTDKAQIMEYLVKGFEQARKAVHF